MADGHRAPVSEMLDRAFAYLPKAPAPMSFVDIGCGNGWVVRGQLLKHQEETQSGDEEACRSSVSALGIDGAAEMIAKARRIEEETPLGAQFLLSDLTALGEHAPANSGDRFDVVFSMEVLYYLTETSLRAVLAALHDDWLKDEGVFVMGIDHYLENTACHDWAELNNTHMLLWSAIQWRTALEEAGFDVQHEWRAAVGDENREEAGTLAFVSTKTKKK